MEIRTTKILIVEDEFITAYYIKKALESHGCEVIDIVKTGEDAVRSALENNPDVIVMDIMLEGEMDGIEAAEAIKDRKETSIIYQTANSDRSTYKRAVATNPAAYLKKPINTGELVKSVDLLIN